MNKIAGLFHKLLYDNRVLMVVSFLAAIVIWLAVTISLSPIDTIVVKDVPVNIDLVNSVPAQFDLEIFGQNEFFVDVEVSGKRYILSSQANKNSIKVVAQTAYVDSSGKHTLNLKATKINETDEFEILSISEDYIEVFFDVYMEQDFQLEPKINIDDELVEKGYVAGDAVLSIDTVVVSGPASEIMNIEKVCAQIDVDKPLSQTTTQEAEIIAYNSSGANLHYLGYSFGDTQVTVTVPVYYITTKPTSVSFKNAPSDYIDSPFSFTVSPAEFTCGIQDKDKADEMSSISIGTIDFSQLKPGRNVFEIPSDSIPSVFSLEASKTFTVTVNVDNFQSITLSPPEDNISFINVPEGYSVKEIVKSLGSVTVIGPEESLLEIESDEIYAIVDLSNADISATQQEFNAKVNLKNSSDCWVCGDYTVTVRP